jgi:glycosyltransferase involved in cell wall biosynthesis
MYRALSSRPDIFDLYVYPTGWGQSSWVLSGKETDGVEKYIEKLHHFKGTFDVSLQVLIPSEFENLATKNIGVTAAVETTAASPEWINKANFMDMVFVTSEHAKKSLVTPKYSVQAEDGKTYNIVMQKPVEVISYPFREFEEDKTVHEKVKLETKFNFFTSAQLGPRKNLMNTIHWFVQEFKDDEDVGLVVKAHHMNNSHIDRQKMVVQLAAAIHSVPHRKCKVYLVHGSMRDDEMNSIFTHPDIHAYITATHGEGFGLPIFEAACNGMPVVAPAWSGQVDFLYDNVKNEKSGKSKRTPMFTKVKYTLGPIQQEAVWNTVLNAETEWCYPDEKSFKKALRSVKNAYRSKKKVAEDLQKSLKQKLNHEKMLEYVVDQVLKVCPQDFVELEGFFNSLSEELEVHE